MPKISFPHGGSRKFEDNNNTRGEEYRVVKGNHTDFVKIVTVNGQRFVSVTPVAKRDGGRITPLVK